MIYPTALFLSSITFTLGRVAPRSAMPLAAPMSAAVQDSAAVLYQAARAALNDGDYDRAADLFRRVSAGYPRSTSAADALYYEAFARYRAGGTTNLRAALASLDAQRARYTTAATRDDAAALGTRIRGELARTGDADAAAAVSDGARAAAGTACPRGDGDERTAALSALAQMDAAQAAPVLERVLARRDACSTALRRQALFLLAQHGTAGTADALLRVAQTDPDPSVREQAVFWLSQVHTPRATEILAGIVNGPSDPGLQEKALFALSQQGTPESARLLRDVATRDGANEAVRARAIFWLGQGQSADNAAFLKGIYGRLASPTLKERVLFAISQQRNPGNIQWLLGVAEDTRESVDVRKHALFWASQGGAGLDQLTALYNRIRDRELREQLIFVYSQRREPAAVDQLLDVARHDPDVELRKKAIFWLGQSHDPRAAQFLAALLER